MLSTTRYEYLNSHGSRVEVCSEDNLPPVVEKCTCLIEGQTYSLCFELPLLSTTGVWINLNKDNIVSAIKDVIKFDQNEYVTEPNRAILKKMPQVDISTGIPKNDGDTYLLCSGYSIEQDNVAKSFNVILYSHIRYDRKKDSVMLYGKGFTVREDGSFGVLGSESGIDTMLSNEDAVLKICHF